MRESSGTVLIIDDDPSYRAMLATSLKKRVAKLLTAASAEEGLELLGYEVPDLVLLDMRMPGMGGIGFLKNLRERPGRVPVIVLTAFAAVEDAVEAMRLGAEDYLSKPIDLALLEDRLGRFLPPDPARGCALELPPVPAGICFESPLMGQVLRELSSAADSSAAVLLVGESGTGKEVLADLLHQWSSRRAGPQVSLNVTALPDTLLESELFGHEAGAFTGAGKRRIGHFERAHTGTLFLDEIGDLPSALQPKLLRALDCGTLRRIGGDAEIPVDLRLVSATHQDLPEAVSQGRFRLDLYYRIAVFVTEIPPLRERPEDILPLARRFLEVEAAGRRKQLAHATQNILLGHGWPGNIRELKNSIQRSAILAPGEWILPEHLPPALTERAETGNTETPEPRALAQIEKEAILNALERSDGNRTRAAQELGISRRKLLYRLKEYGESG